MFGLFQKRTLEDLQFEAMLAASKIQEEEETRKLTNEWWSAIYVGTTNKTFEAYRWAKRVAQMARPRP